MKPIHKVESLTSLTLPVKTQIESLGGKVEIESQLGVGTTFYVYFPV